MVWPQYVDLEIGPLGDLAQHRFALGLLLRVVVLVRPARRHCLGQRHRVVGVIAVCRNRRCVDQARRPGGCHRRLEDVSAAGQVDPAAVLARSHDQVRQMDDDVGVRNQCVDGTAVENVPLAVLGLCPAVGDRIERAPGHPDDPLDGRIALQRVDCGDAYLAGGSGHRDRQPRHPAVGHDVSRSSKRSTY